MKTIRFLMAERELAELDRIARTRKVDRSTLIRAAIRKFVSRAQVEEREQHDIAVYRKRPITRTELNPWIKAQVRPK